MQGFWRYKVFGIMYYTNFIAFKEWNVTVGYLGVGGVKKLRKHSGIL